MPNQQTIRLKSLLAKSAKHCPPSLAGLIQAELARTRGAKPRLDPARVRKMATSMTQSAIAAELGVTRQAVSKLLRRSGSSASAGPR